MIPEKYNQLDLRNEDCLPAMREMDDNQFDLAICDPPYGQDINKSGRLVKEKGWKYKKWDKQPPDFKYFQQLFRISKNQIIWGGNYYNLPGTKCYLIWDKKQPEDVSYASAELAWTSFNYGIKTFYWHPQTQNKKRIHPTQKPVALYKWLLKNYAEPGQTILDTHLGSGSIAIACYDLGFALTGFEIDEDYYTDMMHRLNNHVGNFDAIPKEKKKGLLF